MEESEEGQLPKDTPYQEDRKQRLGVQGWRLEIVIFLEDPTLEGRRKGETERWECQRPNNLAGAKTDGEAMEPLNLADEATQGL